jgi:hypothetical protein
MLGQAGMALAIEAASVIFGLLCFSTGWLLGRRRVPKKVRVTALEPLPLDAEVANYIDDRATVWAQERGTPWAAEIISPYAKMIARLRAARREEW